MIRTLIPAAASAEAQAANTWRRVLRTTLTVRAIVLLAAGLLWAVPGFFGLSWIAPMLAWDGLVIVLALIDAAMLTPDRGLRVTRAFLDAPVLGSATRMELQLLHEAKRMLRVHVADDLHPALTQIPPSGWLTAFPRDAAMLAYTVTPNRRGDYALGGIWLRWRGPLNLVERRTVSRPQQRVRVYPPMEPTVDDAALYLLRIRQIEMQRRRLRLVGMGREFDHLRDYRSGDEIRNVSWPATARRSRLVTREFSTERSQQVWIVLDAGRLSRTVYETGWDRSAASSDLSFRDAAVGEQFRMGLTQLDLACGAAITLAQAVMQTGDKAGLMVYGRGIQRQLLPSSGAGQLRAMIDALSTVRSESSEADHLRAAARLGQLQRRRGLVLWITEMADSVRRPEVADAAAELAQHHLVLFIALSHPEIAAIAERKPDTPAQMYESAAAQELLERRRRTLAGLRSRGVLVVETTSGAVRADAINEYLKVKARGMV